MDKRSNGNRVLLVDDKYSFFSAFDRKTGEYFRSGIIEGNADTSINPFMASYPHLIDVGIMGHCAHGNDGLCAAAGIGCYQSGGMISRPNMAVDDFASIARQCAGKVFQFALGGRGDPDQHEDLVWILELCRDNEIVPNFTTSGYRLTKDIARECRRCGAVAVSWYRNSYTYKAIDNLLSAGVKTNVHYVLGNDSIDEAIARLQDDDFPAGINAVIFLLHKPVGLGSANNVLSLNNSRVRRFFELLNEGGYSFKTGMDSCAVPGILNHCPNIQVEALDTCEGGRFSCYIDADMNMIPCSFDRNLTHAISLRGQTIKQSWDSNAFAAFRKHLYGSCLRCGSRADCMGGCPLMPEIVLCDKPERRIDCEIPD